MQIGRVFAVGAATVTLFAAASASHAATIVSDGDFTTPSGGVTYTTYYGGSSFGPWKVTGKSVDLIGGYWQAPPGGGGSVDVDGNAPGGISQDLGVLKAGAYDLTFYLSGNPDGAPSTKILDVSVGSVSKTLDAAKAVSRADMGYVLETIDFTSNGLTPTTLSFASGDTGPHSYYGAVVGDVSVSAIPEPATWALFMLGVGMTGLAARRRQISAAVPA
jgi:choice-of-anchor C domain-containing protein